MRWKLLDVVLAAMVGLAQAQEATGTRSVFDVASVKVTATQSRRNSDGGPGTRDPGQYHFTRAELRDLIAIAYQVRDFQILSKLPLDRGNFDVVAKVPMGATRNQFREMMQNLLTERFHLNLHRESRDLPAWEMTIAKSGLKLKESTVETEIEPIPAAPPKARGGGFPVRVPNNPGLTVRFTALDRIEVGRLAAQRQPVSALSGCCKNEGDPPIVDKTGLTGKYDLELEFARQSLSATVEAEMTSLPDFFKAAEQQLGLHFALKKLAFDVLVVDSV